MVIGEHGRPNDGGDERSDFEEENPVTDHGDQEDNEGYHDVGVPVDKLDYDDPGVIVVKSIDDERHEVDLRLRDASMRLVRVWEPKVSITDSDISVIWRYYCNPEKNRRGFLTRDDLTEILGDFEDPGIESQ